MIPRVRIPETEYQERIRKAAALAGERGLDVLVVNSNEADYANVRYFSNFWPLFETAGVAISPPGKAALMVGPESLEIRLRPEHDPEHLPIDGVSRIGRPRLPGGARRPSTPTFSSRSASRASSLKIGVGGYLVSNPIQLAGLKECYPECGDRARRRHHGRPAQRQVGERDRLHSRRPADHRDRHRRKSSATSSPA